MFDINKTSVYKAIIQLDFKSKELPCVELGHKNDSYFTEEEMINGYIPPTYEEALKEYEDNN